MTGPPSAVRRSQPAARRRRLRRISCRPRAPRAAASKRSATRRRLRALAALGGGLTVRGSMTNVGERRMYPILRSPPHNAAGSRASLAGHHVSSRGAAPLTEGASGGIDSVDRGGQAEQARRTRQAPMHGARRREREEENEMEPLRTAVERRLGTEGSGRSRAAGIALSACAWAPYHVGR